MYEIKNVHFINDKLLQNFLNWYDFNYLVVNPYSENVYL